MVRLSLSMGSMHGIRPNDIVGTIAFHADIPGSTIGKIHIHDKHTLVDVPEKFPGPGIGEEWELPHPPAAGQSEASLIP